MDTHNWVPMRWPSGPLEIERGSRRQSFSAEEHEALEQWESPRMLEQLAGTPFNCLVVTWADGSPSDESQQRSLGPLVSAARAAGLAVVGDVAQGADLRQAAAAADSAGLQALSTESSEPFEGFPVLRFGEPSVADHSPRPFLGVSGLPWPGLKVELSTAADAVSGPTGPPWIDSNAWLVRLAGETIRPETTWLSYQPPEEGLRDPGAAYVQAIADAEVYGARWMVSLDVGSRLDLAHGRAPGQETWSQIVQALEFFEAHRAWASLTPVGLLGVMSDFSGPNEFMSFEVLNLLSRYSRLFRIISRGRVDAALATAPADANPFAGLEALLYVDETPPGGALLRRLHAFAEAGGTLITAPGWDLRGEAVPRSSFSRFHLSRLGQGRLAVAREEFADPYRLAEDAQALMSHRHDLIRVFNPGTGRFAYSRSEDGRSAVVHVFPYSRYSFETHVSVWLREPWQSANVWVVGAAEPERAERTLTETGVEFLLPTEREVIRPRSTNSDVFVRPAAAYRAVELSS